MARRLEVEIVGDASSYQRALGSADSTSSKFGRTLGNLAKAGAFAAGAAGIGGVFVTLSAGISEFREATKVAAQTEAAIKSTGGVAGITAKHVDDLAESIMRYSGVDDEAIKQTQNLLLSFTNIRNEAGKGNAIFDRLTKTIIDFSVRTGRDAASSATLLGKALEDPATKLSGLARAGIIFTDQQKKMVKGMVDSGKTLEAQKLVLAELEKRYGGAAEAAGKTLPGQLNILKESFNNLAGDLVAKAVPAVTSFVGFLNEKGLPALEETFGRISEVVGPAFAGLGDTLKAAGPAIMGVLEPLGRTIAETLVPVFQQLQEIGSRAMTEISAVIKANGPELRRIFENLGQVISNLAKIILPVLDFAFTKVLPVAINVLIPLLVGVTEAMATIATITRVVANVITAILVTAFNVARGVASALVAVYENTLGPAFLALGVVVKTIAGVLRSVLVPAFDVVESAAQGVRSLFMWFSEKAGAIFKKLAVVLVPAMEAITAPFQILVGVISHLIGNFKAFIDKAGEVIDLASKVGGAVGGLIGKIPGFASGVQNFGGGLAIVGEKGPELVRLPAGSDVIPNSRLRSHATTPVASVGGSRGFTLIQNFHGPVVGAGREFEDAVRRALYDVSRRNPSLSIA